jgi:uncharacterized membrane protein
MMRPSKKRSVWAAPLCTVVLFAGFITNASAQTLTVFDVPGATQTWPIAINNRGAVTGAFCPTGPICLDKSSWRGFIRDVHGHFTVFDGVPVDINDAGAVAGFYFRDKGGAAGFVRDQHENWIPFDVLAIPGVNPTGNIAINNRSEVVGFFVGYSAPVVFMRNSPGKITIASIPNGFVPTSVNERGDITGSTGNTSEPYYGFVQDARGNISTFQVDPSASHAVFTFPNAINNRGDVAGGFYDPNLFMHFGFVRRFDGTIQVLNSFLIPTAINDAGVVAGSVGTDSCFVRDQLGNVRVFQLSSDSSGAQVTGINDRGDVVGSFSELHDGVWITRGFLNSAH